MNFVFLLKKVMGLLKNRWLLSVFATSFIFGNQVFFNDFSENKITLPTLSKERAENTLNKSYFNTNNIFYWKDNYKNKSNAVEINGKFYALNQKNSFMFNKNATFYAGFIDTNLRIGELNNRFFGKIHLKRVSGEGGDHMAQVVYVTTKLGETLSNTDVFMLPISDNNILTIKDLKNDIINNNIKVVNMSLGVESVFNRDFLLSNQSFENVNMYKELMEKHDVLFVVAAGNDGGVEPNEFGNLFFKNKDAFINVGALRDGRLLKSSSTGIESNRCGSSKNHCVFANGVDKIHNGQDYNIVGTSIAAPNVTKLAITLRNLYPFLTSKQVKEVILTNAKDLGEKGVDSVYGYGEAMFDESLKLHQGFFTPTTFDLAKNNGKVKPKRVYHFASNNLLGSANIVFSNALKDEVVSFANQGSYNGTISVKKAILNVDGNYPNMNINNLNGKVYGMGSINNLVSNSDFYNYSYFAKNGDEVVPMLINGDLRLGENSRVFGSKPLRVKGKANINGVIVGNFKKGDLVVYAEKGIFGRFKNCQQCIYEGKRVIYN